MAVGPFVEYNSFRRYIADGTIDVNSDEWKLAFYQSTSNAATATLSTRTSVTNEVANGNGYATGGKTLTGVVWSTGASAGQMRFKASALTWTATGGTIPNVKYAVLYNNTTGASAGARKLALVSTLSTGQFTVSQSNQLQIDLWTNGIFNLT